MLLATKLTKLSKLSLKVKCSSKPHCRTLKCH